MCSGKHRQTIKQRTMQQITKEKEKIDLSMPIKTIPFATDQRGRIINALRIHGNINSLG